MVSNNIIIVFCRPFSFHIIAAYTEACIQSQFLAFVISVHLVFRPVNWTMLVRGLPCNLLKYRIVSNYGWSHINNGSRLVAWV